MPIHDSAPSIDSVSDPWEDDDSAEVTPGATPRTDPQPLLGALWAMLARPAIGGASTLIARRQEAADALALSLRGRPVEAELAVALADMLKLAGREPDRFGATAKAACVEAVERLMLAMASGPEPTVRWPRTARHTLPPVVVVGLPSASASRRVQAVLSALGMEVHLAPDVEALNATLSELAADLVIAEVGLRSVVADAALEAEALCDAVRALPMHTRTPLLCLDNGRMALASRSATTRAGVRVAPRPMSRAELVLRVRVLLPLE